MATFLSSQKMSLLIFVLAMCLHLHCTVAQLRQSGPPLRPSNTNNNIYNANANSNSNSISNPNPNQNLNQNSVLNPSNGANNRQQGRNLPRSANFSASNLRSQTTQRPAGDQSATGNNNNKVSVQLSRAIAQDQSDVITDDRSFANPGADRIDEHVVLEGTNVTSSGATPVQFPPPQRQHFKPGKLLAQLENEFDPLWLSIERPTVRVERPPAASVVPDADLADRVAALNFSLFTLYDSIGQPLQPQPGLVSLFKTWLHRYSTCQMEYFWEEMDIHFWPRYIKRGMCVNDQPCSFPPGMRCKQSRNKSLKILRWVCSLVAPTTGERATGRTIIKRDSSDGTVAAAGNIRVKPGNRQRQGQNQNGNGNGNGSNGNGNGNGNRNASGVANGNGQKKKRNGQQADRQNNRNGPKRNGGKRNMNNRRRKEKRDALYNDPDITYRVDDVFCQWEPVVYTVVDKCSCSCAIN